MSIGKFLQILCVWIQTGFYTLGGYYCAISGGVMSIIGAFFLLIGAAQILKLFNGSILKFESH